MYIILYVDGGQETNLKQPTLQLKSAHVTPPNTYRLLFPAELRSCHRAS